MKIKGMCTWSLKSVLEVNCSIELSMKAIFLRMQPKTFSLKLWNLFFIAISMAFATEILSQKTFYSRQASRTLPSKLLISVSVKCTSSKKKFLPRSRSNLNIKEEEKELPLIWRPRLELYVYDFLTLMLDTYLSIFMSYIQALSIGWSTIKFHLKVEL